MRHGFQLPIIMAIAPEGGMTMEGAHMARNAKGSANGMRRSMFGRALVCGLAAGTLAMTLGGCGSSSTSGSSTAASSAAATTAAASATTKSDYAVTIDGAQMATDYEGNSCVVVTYTFTNNATDAQAFLSSVTTDVYQNGVECESAICTDIDSAPSMSKVQTGASIQVQMAYKVADTSDIQVDVLPIVSLDNTKLASQTFSLA